MMNGRYVIQGSTGLYLRQTWRDAPVWEADLERASVFEITHRWGDFDRYEHDTGRKYWRHHAGYAQRIFLKPIVREKA